MREIQAPRAWYKPLGTMIQPEEVESINFETKVIGVYMQMDGKGFHRLRLSDFEVMRPTGLKDRNGQEIYEGDIIKQPYHAEGRDETGLWTAFDGHHIGLVSMLPSKGVVMKNPLRYSEETDETSVSKLYKHISSRRAEVIGNRWEHPHLLKEA